MQRRYILSSRLQNNRDRHTRRFYDCNDPMFSVKAQRTLLLKVKVVGFKGAMLTFTFPIQECARRFGLRPIPKYTRHQLFTGVDVTFNTWRRNNKLQNFRQKKTRVDLKKIICYARISTFTRSTLVPNYNIISFNRYSFFFFFYIHCVYSIAHK